MQREILSDTTVTFDFDNCDTTVTFDFDNSISHTPA